MTKKKTQKATEPRALSYATILYPESAKEGWQKLLEDLHIKVMISPLHDKDCSESGETKKPHYHILFLFPSLKSRKQVKQITDKIGGVGVERVLDPIAMARYLCHLDSPDKETYNPDDVVAFNIDYYDFIMKKQDSTVLITDILSFIDEERVYSFAYLVRECRRKHPEWLKTIVNKTYFLQTYLKSRKYQDGIEYAQKFKEKYNLGN